MSAGTGKAKKPRKKPSLFRRAFANQYNYILLGAAGLFAIATFSWLPLLIGAGVEALWLTLGADTTLFKRWVAIQEGKEKQEELTRAAATAMETLGPGYKQRFHELSKLADEINQMAIDNPSLDNDLIQGEMDKLGSLLHSFLQMGLAHQRLFDYVRDNDETEIQREIARLERAVAVEKNRDVNASLRQSLALSQKRMKQHAGIEAAYKVLTVKMETLEKAFRYLKSHILSVNKKEDLAEEIDGLVSGVESVEELTADTGTLLADLRSVRAAQSIKGH